MYRVLDPSEMDVLGIPQDLVPLHQDVWLYYLKARIVLEKGYFWVLVCPNSPLFPSRRGSTDYRSCCDEYKLGLGRVGR